MICDDLHINNGDIRLRNRSTFEEYICWLWPNSSLRRKSANPIALQHPLVPGREICGEITDLKTGLDPLVDFKRKHLQKKCSN